jgi:ATP-dependent DNA helicase RecG
MGLFGWKDRTKFRERYIKLLIEMGILNMTVPDKPNSSKQKYFITEKGRKFLKNIKSE